MELSKRLQAAANLLSDGCRIADIGCDHGFLSIYLVQTGKASGSIAMDINKGPLERAVENIDRQGLSTYIETRLSDGAKALAMVETNDGERKTEVDAAVLAGMGGRLMIKIMQDSLDKFEGMQEFILQPQSEIRCVRKFIREAGFMITAEDMVLEDGKFYPMMKVEKRSGENRSSGCMQELFDEFGEYLLKERHPVLKQFLTREESILKKIAEKLSLQSSAKSRERSKEIQDKLEKIRQGLEWFLDEV